MFPYLFCAFPFSSCISQVEYEKATHRAFVAYTNRYRMPQVNGVKIEPGVISDLAYVVVCKCDMALTNHHVSHVNEPLNPEQTS